MSSLKCLSPIGHPPQHKFHLGLPETPRQSGHDRHRNNGDADRQGQKRHLADLAEKVRPVSTKDQSGQDPMQQMPMSKPC
jgi:hypothetical protein